MTTSEIIDKINELSAVGDFQLIGESIRSIDGYCPVCWLDKKINNYSGNKTMFIRTKLYQNYPNSIVYVVIAADSNVKNSYMPEIRQKLINACKI